MALSWWKPKWLLIELVSSSWSSFSVRCHRQKLASVLSASWLISNSDYVASTRASAHRTGHCPNSTIDRPDQTLSETRVSDKVRWVRSGSVQITLTIRLSLVGPGRVVSKFHYTNPTRPDSQTTWISAHIRGLCLVVDWSAQSRHVRTLSVGLVWSGRT